MKSTHFNQLIKGFRAPEKPETELGFTLKSFQLDLGQGDKHYGPRDEILLIEDLCPRHLSMSRFFVNGKDEGGDGCLHQAFTHRFSQ